MLRARRLYRTCCTRTSPSVPACRGSELFDAMLNDAGIEVVLSGIQMPRVNSIMERWVQTCRREFGFVHFHQQRLSSGSGGILSAPGIEDVSRP